MSRTKHSDLFCAYCNKMTRMTLVGEMHVAGDKLWYKCSRCHHMTLTDLKVEESELESQKVDVNSAILYDPQEIFQVGQSIFHNEWNDVGKVLSKTRTSDGNHAIVVSFEKQGQRTLIENVKVEV